MKSKLHILHLEDSEFDAELIKLLLQQTEFDCLMDRVENREDFKTLLKRGDYDLILSDFSMPGFNGLDALAMARSRRPEIPFLFVSGTIGEEVAIEALKSGATDYILKDRLARLKPAVRRALTEAEKRAELQRAEEAMIQSEFKYRQIFECLGEAAILADARTGRILDTNRQAEVLFDRPRAALVGLELGKLHPGMSPEAYQQTFVEPLHVTERITFETDISLKDGSLIPVEVSASPILLHGRHLLLALYRDISLRKQLEEEIKALKNSKRDSSS